MTVAPHPPAQRGLALFVATAQCANRPLLAAIMVAVFWYAFGLDVLPTPSVGTPVAAAIAVFGAVFAWTIWSRISTDGGLRVQGALSPPVPKAVAYAAVLAAVRGVRMAAFFAACIMVVGWADAAELMDYAGLPNLGTCLAISAAVWGAAAFAELTTGVAPWLTAEARWTRPTWTLLLALVPWWFWAAAGLLAASASDLPDEWSPAVAILVVVGAAHYLGQVMTAVWVRGRHIGYGSLAALLRSASPPPSVVALSGCEQELDAMLAERDGFLALDGALWVFSRSDADCINAPDGWRASWGCLEGLRFFAADAFGVLFAINDGAVVRFEPASGEVLPEAVSLEMWARQATKSGLGSAQVRAWAVSHGPLPEGERLVALPNGGWQAVPLGALLLKRAADESGA